MKNSGFSVFHLANIEPWLIYLSDCFKYSNIANEFVSKLPPGVTYGQGPFREVRLLVDGQIAGAVYPYATIFTGGIVPTAWR